SDGFIDHVLATMLLSPQHTFQILTKRSDRLPEYIRGIDLYRRVLDAASGKRRVRPDLAGVGISNPKTFPAPWVWWGVSVEDRKHGLPRIEHLRRTPAALRFLSIEPLLEDLGKIDLSGIDWVIVGGESGPGARPFDLAWARSIRDQCRAAGVAFFFKQAGSVPWDSNVNMGEYGDGPPLKNTPRGVKAGAASFGLDLKDKKGGDPSEWPADLQDCREMPEARHA
ncbi:MAG TPA: DUF5131 family protein, partial [Polyangiaceae bacterium]|nr:DUF5131 family protein [Polyangiaceae bacterium]